MSFYADDAALFVNPCFAELAALKRTLLSFGEISGLKINEEKYVLYPIQCNDQNIAEFLQRFGGPCGSFPCTYLGLPLSTHKLRGLSCNHC